MVTHHVQRQTLFCRADQQSTQGFFERREYTLKERMQRMVKVSSLLFLAACGAVFVPILHFVLVPALLVCALVFGVAAWLDKAEILSGEFTCPQCTKLNTLARGSESFPLSIRCQHCYFSVRLDVRP